jgi:hypothetical protein
MSDRKAIYLHSHWHGTVIHVAQSSMYRRDDCGILMTAHLGGSLKSAIDIYWLGQGWAGVRQIAC